MRTPFSKSAIASSSPLKSSATASSPDTVTTPTTDNISAALLSASATLPSTFTDGYALPRTLIFDLDYTLWPFWVDTHVSPPIKPCKLDASTSRKANSRASVTDSKDGWTSNVAATDRSGDVFAFYKDVPRILVAARARGMRVAAASRTHAPDLAMDMLRILVVPGDETFGNGSGKSQGAAKENEKEKEKERPAKSAFDSLQIFPGNKVQHMKKIQKAFGGPAPGEAGDYEQMLFFDDEGRNRNVEQELGICFQLVQDGVTCAEVDRGVKRWRRARGLDGSS